MAERRDDAGTGAPGREDDALAPFFAAARRDAPAVPEALMAAILADARDSLPPVRARPLGRWQRLRSALGGWPSLAGLGTAAAAGLALGLLFPAGLARLDDALGGALPVYETAALTGYVLEDLMPGFDPASEEGLP
jgi:hypothetical protein